jgi:hypothetical protein
MSQRLARSRARIALRLPGAIGEMTRRHLPTFAAAGGFIDFAPEVERLINHCRSDCRPVAGYG